MSASDPSDTPASRRRTSLIGRWAPVALYMAGIFFASSLSDPPMPSQVSDVSLHGASYFGLTLLLIRALSANQRGRVSLVTIAGACAMAMAYGITDEWHQSFVPHRQAQWRDVIADASGAFAAAVVVGAWGIIRRL